MSKAPKITTEDRALILRTAHAFRRETRLDWSTCQLAAWDAFRTMKFNQVFEAYRAAGKADKGWTFDDAKAFAEHPNPYRQTVAEMDAPKAQRTRAAADAVFHARMAAKYKRAA